MHLHLSRVKDLRNAFVNYYINVDWYFCKNALCAQVINILSSHDLKFAICIWFQAEELVVRMPSIWWVILLLAAGFLYGDNT